MKRITSTRLRWYGFQLALLLALAFALGYEASCALDFILVVAVGLWTLLVGLGEWQLGPLGSTFRRATLDDQQDLARHEDSVDR